MPRPIPYTLTTKAHTALAQEKTMRYTKTTIDNQVKLINDALEERHAAYRVRRYSFNGGHSITRVSTDPELAGNTLDNLIECTTARECVIYCREFFYALIAARARHIIYLKTLD